MTRATYADVFRPTEGRYLWLYDLLLILGGSLLIGLSAQVAIPLPFSPVPITGQTFAVLLAGALLGSRRGSLCVLTYLAEGLAGLPVFVGTGGIGHFLGPTGGYLIGFVVAAYAVGQLAERGWDKRFITSLLAMLLGNVVIYTVGLLWLSRFVGAERVLTLGLYPFVIGDLLKIALATGLLPIGWKVLNSKHSNS
ncbi:biotin transporter BioY [Oculatella sp. LEGE 06141]|uniref:biotin transporter BioY n=1 Tax=Oculatella sp. LEGE 06141 TaxID=1828648 RepID=UPI001881A222|nr:biotin transporter BioY [Oculatella sp. LEGE 06141]MBE9179600.1 biotin transporter BioY [Oculatella sp. LEGE 06141]